MNRGSFPLKSRTYSAVLSGQKSFGMKNTCPSVPYRPVTTPGPDTLLLEWQSMVPDDGKGAFGALMLG